MSLFFSLSHNYAIAFADLKRQIASFKTNAMICDYIRFADKALFEALKIPFETCTTNSKEFAFQFMQDPHMPSFSQNILSGASHASAKFALAATLALLVSSPAGAQEAATPQDQPAPQTSEAVQLGDEQDPTMVRENHGAWSMICDQPPGSSLEQCALMQNVIADDRPEIGLSIAVLKTADRQATLLRILSPLGVFLPEGMGLFIDGVNIGKASFSRCYLDGCYVEVDIDEDLMKILRVGKEAVFTLNFSIDQDTIGIPVDLAGFAEGFDALP